MEQQIEIWICHGYHKALREVDGKPWCSFHSCVYVGERSLSKEGTEKGLGWGEFEKQVLGTDLVMLKDNTKYVHLIHLTTMRWLSSTCR